MTRNFGFLKARAASPAVAVANPEKNTAAALSAVKEAREAGVQLLVLPELFLSAYTCADLFFQNRLLDRCREGLETLRRESEGSELILVAGLPLEIQNTLYNCAAVIQNGEILGVVPKEYLPNYQEFYEKRWFASGSTAGVTSVTLCGREVPFGSLLFDFGWVTLGVELCEDLWVPIPPSSYLSLAGAEVIVNLSASNELVTKNDYRKNLVAGQSGRCICGYVYASEGVMESTTDLVFSGSCTVCENGAILADSERFLAEGSMAQADIDVLKLRAERRKNKSFHDNASVCLKTEYRRVKGTLSPLPEEKVDRFYDPHPFVPGDEGTRELRCREIFAIQSAGLARRLAHTGLKKTVVGISGGLDSTLALLVMDQAMKRLSLPAENMICVTMPGFGTTDHTYQSALELIASLGATLREVDIRPACIQHMKDIGHDPSVHDITYENTQARERTQILMDTANKEGAILVGTGDLSELAMGWCTYNGDHMSMYGVNASVPKTLVRYLVGDVASRSDPRTAAVLRRILDTPVSPELLPPDENGEIAQKTEDNIGPYELHDFFLYHFLRFGCDKEKLFFLAGLAFKGKYDGKTIEKWLDLFLKRFFASQFKRSCMPDGPKVGSVSLSPRGDWRMPSDADRGAFLD